MIQKPSNSLDDRSDFAKAYGLASHIITGCMMMAVPLAVGYWIDQRFSQRIPGWGSIIGLLLGVVCGGGYLVIWLWSRIQTSMTPAPPAARPFDDSDWDEDANQSVDDDNERGHDQR